MTQSNEVEVAEAVRFGQWLREALEDREMSQRELAEAIGTDPGRISEYCRAAHSPSLGRVAAICRALNDEYRVNGGDTLRGELNAHVDAASGPENES